MTQQSTAIPTDRLDKPALGLMTVVARNSAFVLGSQVLIKAIAFAFNVFVVRRLGAVHYGQYAATMAYVAIFGIFTDLGMAPYSVREMAEDRSQTRWLLPNSVAIRLLLSLIIMTVAPLSAFWLGKENYLLWGILIASAGQLLWAFQGPLSSALIAHERLDYDATFACAEQLVFWSIGTLTLLGGLGFIGLILASLAGVGARALLSGWALSRRMGVGQLELNPRRWLPLLGSALPFGISGIAFTLRQRFDTVLTSFVLTDEAVGLYNVPLSLVGMLLLLAFSVGQAMYPSMARAHATSPDALRRLTRRAIKYLLIISLPVAVGGSILAERIIITLYTEEFSASIPILRIMLWALPALFLLELLGRLANALHLERQLARVTVINAGITIALDLALVPTLGIVGAAVALVIGRSINLVQDWLLIGREQLLGQRWGDLLRVFIAAGAMGVAVFFLRKAHLAISIGGGALLYGALLLVLRGLDRKEIADLIGMFFRSSESRYAAREKGE